MRKLESKSERWPGYIGIPATFTIPQAIIVADMLDSLEEIKKPNATRVSNAALPYLFRLVEEWGIEGIEPGLEHFPAEPLKEANKFVDWWLNEVLAVFSKEEPKNA